MLSLRRRRPAVLVFALSASLCTPRVATSHFFLRSPASWRAQDTLGNPQKAGPCGNEGAATTTGTVTPFSPGETITIALDETVYHPGHYRIALAVNDRSELPAAPAVAPGATACGTAPVMTPPVFPVLADGVLLHEAPLSGTQSIQVTLPSSVICSRCTLQVLEFMSNHAAPCFYYHCADLSIGIGNGGGCSADGDCDDGNACTQDACSAVQGCSSQPVTFADVNADFLGTLQVHPCATEKVPRVVGTLFGKATTSVTRAATSPAQGERFLKRALQHLRGAGRKAKARRISVGCRAALGTVVDAARTRIECLRSRTVSAVVASGFW